MAETYEAPDGVRPAPGELFACVEAGGTKFVCAIAAAPRRIVERISIPTTSPDETLSRVSAFFRNSAPGGLKALGIASFGPVDIDRSSDTWGDLLDTPKIGWSNASLARRLSEDLALPVDVDTDVNAAARAEAVWGAGHGHGHVAYVTVGTGIGAGAVSSGVSLIGRRHSEAGHIWPVRHPLDGHFLGCCPFHGACLEGLASGPAIQARWGCSLDALPVDHPGREIIGWYLGQLVTTLLATLSPHRIIFGGGVLRTEGLLPYVVRAAQQFSGGYFATDEEVAAIVQPAALGQDAGVLGALLLAQGHGSTQPSPRFLHSPARL